MTFSKVFLICFTGISVSCTNLVRSNESGYSNTNSRRSGTRAKEGPAPMNISQKTRLKQLENSLSSRKEIEQYSKALPWFYNAQERIQFLSVPGFEARQKWLSDRDFNSRTGELQSEMKELVEAQDIAIGMPQALVRQAWGDPDAVEVSGNPQFKNERWRYNRYVSSQDGYKSERRVVYFEGGKVVAWELE